MPDSKLFGRIMKLYGSNSSVSSVNSLPSNFASATYIKDIPVAFPIKDGTGSLTGDYLFQNGSFVNATASAWDLYASMWQLMPIICINNGYTGSIDLEQAYNLFPNRIELDTSFTSYYVTDDDLSFCSGFFIGDNSKLPIHCTFNKSSLAQDSLKNFLNLVIFGNPTFSIRSWSLMQFVTNISTGQGQMKGSMAYNVTLQNNSWWFSTVATLNIAETTGFVENYVPPVAPSDPYSDLDGESEITGGGTGAVNVPGFPGLTATSTGIIGLFAPSAAQMQALASYMWTDFGGQGTDVVSVLLEIVEAIKRAISNPLDYVIGLNIIPSQGLSIGSSQTIRFGFTNTNVSMPALTNQYFTVDCGSLDFDPICGDTFLDYAPYSKFSIYLPYIGVKEVDANDFVGHTISVIYHGDTVTGGVTAYILKDGSVMYQYSGCCALNVPLSADNWGNTISGAVQIATAVISAGASTGAAGAIKAAALGASSVAANPSLLSPQVSHSGAVSGGAGCMAVQYPFVIREAVRFHSTEGFNAVSGYPSFYYKQLSEMTGYTKVLDVHLHNMTATQDEISEIESILKEGAIL